MDDLNTNKVATITESSPRFDGKDEHSYHN